MTSVSVDRRNGPVPPNPFTWPHVESDSQAGVVLRELGVPVSDTPIVIGRNGKFRRNPTLARVAQGNGQRIDSERVLDDGALPPSKPCRR